MKTRLRASGLSSGELTARALVLGIILAVAMTAANTYLGLYAGMTVSASIPAAVISMAVMRGMLRTGSLLENNIVQTMASAGESLAAGIIFTVPALVIIGVWKDFQFWPTTLIAFTGGLLGIIFMIPLRRVLIVEDETLTYPEGVACAEVLQAGETGGSSLHYILKGLGIGGAVKFLTTGVKSLLGTVEGAAILGKRVFFMGCDISPAMAGVGYIIGFRIALLVFLGSAGAWIVAIPLMGIPESFAARPPLETAWHLWKNSIRYAGVGAMVVGGLWSIVSVRSGIASGLRGLARAAQLSKEQKGGEVKREDRDLSLVAMASVFGLALVCMAGLYEYLTGQWGLSIVTAVAMALAAFFFVAVSSYIVGMVGSTNNPVSGMTISALLGVAALFLVLGWKGDSAILATLGVAGVVCCAASSAGDVSQDLKTGHLVGATPRNQQVAQVIGIAAAAGVVAPVLSLLHNAYGIGTGLKAPQATLFASLTDAVFGSGSIPRVMVLAGAAAGVIIIIIDQVLARRGSAFRVPVMPVAVGIYLPRTRIVPMLMGGLVRHHVDRKRETIPEGEDRGVLVASGMIAGEALMGILLAVVIMANIDISFSLPRTVSIPLSLGAVLLTILYLAKREKNRT